MLRYAHPGIQKYRSSEPAWGAKRLLAGSISSTVAPGYVGDRAVAIAVPVLVGGKESVSRYRGKGAGEIPQHVGRRTTAERIQLLGGKVSWYAAAVSSPHATAYWMCQDVTTKGRGCLLWELSLL